jgi:hypothetical protein
MGKQREMMLFVACDHAERRRIRSPIDICGVAVHLQVRVLPLAAEPPGCSATFKPPLARPWSVASASCGYFLSV